MTQASYFTRVLLGTLLALSLTTPALSADSDSANSYETIKQRLSSELGSPVTSIQPSKIPGLLEVIVPPRVIYVSSDGRYVVAGDLYDVDKGANLTQSVRDTARLQALENIGEENMIVYAPKGKVKHTISVFTDIDCGYCRKLHSEMAEYNKLGIKVRYLAYPRAGVDSSSYKKAVTVWCSDDKKTAMDDAKRGKSLPAFKECKNPVKQEMILAQQLGVTGTPSILLENGQLYPGYAPASRLIKVLEQASEKGKTAE